MGPYGRGVSCCGGLQGWLFVRLGGRLFCYLKQVVTLAKREILMLGVR